jgi:hypothetical protein
MAHPMTMQWIEVNVVGTSNKRKLIAQKATYCLGTIYICLPKDTGIVVLVVPKQVEGLGKKYEGGNLHHRT